MESTIKQLEEERHVATLRVAFNAVAVIPAH